MKKRIAHICFFVSLMSMGAAYGQQHMIYNHYFINPFLYNPSYIAPNGYTELYLNYRKQWSGISGAPTTGTMNFHIPLNYKAGIALTASQDEAGLLQTTSGLLSFSYQIYLGRTITDIHKISFGLSAGVSNSRIKSDEADDIQDPVLGNNTSSVDGQFGLHYQYNGFKLGFALPRIFETRVASEESFNKAGINQLNSTISSISYEFKFGSRVSFEPMFTYRTYETLDAQFEGLATFKLSNAGWIGGAYRQDYGAIGFFGLNIKEKYKVGYAYEFATEQSDKIGNGSHEVQLILRLGRKHFARPQASHNTPAATHPVHVQEQKAQTEEKPEVIEETAAHHDIDPVPDETPRDETQVSAPQTDSPQVNEPSVQEQPVQSIAETTPKTETPAAVNVAPEKVKRLDGENLQPGHYVVVGAFEHVQNARNYARTLKKSGYPANISFHPGKGYFIVHMDHADSVEQARELRDKYRQMSRYSFRDTWILTIE